MRGPLNEEKGPLLTAGSIEPLHGGGWAETSSEDEGLGGGGGGGGGGGSVTPQHLLFIYSSQCSKTNS